MVKRPKGKRHTVDFIINYKMKQTSSHPTNNLVAFKEKYDKFIHRYYHETVAEQKKS